MKLCNAPCPAEGLSAVLNAVYRSKAFAFTCLDEERPLANAKCRFDAYAEDIRLFIQQHISVSPVHLIDGQPPLTIPPERPSFITAHNAEAWGSDVLRPAPLADQRHASVLSTCLSS